MRIILSCILSFALVLCSMPIAYADERLSGGFSGSNTNEHRCLYSNRAGSATDAEDRTSSGGRSFATSTPQASSSCVICNIIGTSSDDSLLGSRGLTSYLSASSLASGSFGAASLLSSLSDSFVDSLADLPIVSLFIPPLAYADDGEGEEETEDEPLIYLDDTGEVIYTGSHSIDYESDSDSWSEWDSDGTFYQISYSSSISTLDFDVDDTAFGTLMRALGYEVSSTSGAFGSGYVGWRSISPNDYSYSILHYLEYLYYINTNLESLRSGVSSVVDLLEDIQFNSSQLYYWLLGTTSDTAGISFWSALYDSDSIDINAKPYLGLIYDALSDDIWLTLTSIDGLLSTVSTRLSTINSTLSTGFSNVVEAINNIDISVDSVVVNSSNSYRLYCPGNSSSTGFRINLVGYDADALTSWTLYRLNSDGTRTSLATVTGSTVWFYNSFAADGALYYAEIANGSSISASTQGYYTPYYYLDDDGNFVEYTDTGVFGIYETMLDILEAIENLSIGDLTIFDDIYDELVTVRQNSAYLVSLGSFGSLLSNTSTTNDYLNNIDLSLSTVSANLISALLELSSISSDAEDTVDLLSDIYTYTYSNNSRLNSILNTLYDLEDAIYYVGNLTGTDYSSALADILDAIENISVDVEVDVTVDESSFSIWDLFIGSIAVGTITSAISNLATSAEDTFPIGALVMVAQFLVLLDSDPVAPVYSGEIYGVTVELDLSPYDNMALICRYMLFALYVIGLYKSTKDWAFPMKDD